MALTIVTWLWGGAYTEAHVQNLANACKRHMGEHRYVCFSDREVPGVETIIYQGRKFPNSLGWGKRVNHLRRLWVLSDEAREALGDEIIMLDIDSVLLGPIEVPQEDFKIWKCPSIGKHKIAYNPSVMFMRGDALPGLWDKFLAAPRKTWLAAKNAGWTGNDQAVISHHVHGMNVATWDERDGLFSFRDHGERPPAHAKLVSFYGPYDPAKYLHLDWVAENWR